MANPRQRRKLRSGSHRPVQHSRRAKKLLKKQPRRHSGPKVLQEAWDVRKTVRQNYEALGLAASLNPGAEGEKEEAGRSGSREEAGANGVRKGFGKIIRDAAGNVVDVQLGETESEKEEEEGMSEDVDVSADGQAAGWVGLGSDGRRGESQTGVVQALEQLSACARGVRVRRHTSKGELESLGRLVGKYGDDVEAMARDRRLNPAQRTGGELRRAIRKGGLVG
ncbi:ribosome biogenesis protein Nop16 [Daedaleopsis nitida]|nr:ribosome biogenesis protein Nop16 [Daedaleopsis nitida]